MRGTEFYQLILKRRTIRKFTQQKIKSHILKKVINAARVAPTAANLQFLEYILITEKKIVAKIFPYTKWAAYIYPEGIPEIGERPLYYIAITVNYNRSSTPDLRDVGAAVENIILSALSFGIGSCWLGAIDKEEISKILKLPKHIKLDSLLALGYPKEKPKAIDCDKKIEYWRDKKGRHYVPKRILEKILYFNKYGKRD